jgi:hypothetical protein
VRVELGSIVRPEAGCWPPVGSMVDCSRKGTAVVLEPNIAMVLENDVRNITLLSCLLV